MATIRKRNDTWQIIITCGNSDGKKLRHYDTYRPEKGMTERQAEKGAQKYAMALEEKLKAGFVLDNKQTFEQYSKYVLELKKREGIRFRTLERYGELLERINPAIGHLKLAEIRPQHLNALYKNLSESGIRIAKEMATPKKDLAKMMKDEKLSLAEISRQSGIASSTLAGAKNGNTVSIKTANAFSKALGHKVEYLFDISKDDAPLSNKTVLEHHRLISTIMAQAEKEMLITYNPARKATPPKKPDVDIQVLQPNEEMRVLACLQKESIKWRTIITLLAVTGARRGEIAGLQWNDLSEDYRTIHIQRTLSYSSKKGTYTEGKTKTGEDRFVAIPEQTAKLLKEYREYFEDLQDKIGDAWIDSGYVFVAQNGGAMNPDSITQFLNSFYKKNNLPHLNPHLFRHSMASLLIFNGCDIVAISKRLGHKKVSTTTDIYSHLIKQADAMASDTIADTILPKVLEG